MARHLLRRVLLGPSVLRLAAAPFLLLAFLVLGETRPH